MQFILCKFLFFIFVAIPCQSIVYIVDDSKGKDTNTGQNIKEPFKSINRCVEELKNPGDECQIRKGRYHEIVNVSGLMGTAENPIKIVGYKDEWPMWDGTELIQPIKWKFDSATGVCSAEIEQDIIALFYEDDLLTPARWPNALWSNKTIFDNHFWRPCSGKSTRGNIVDDALAETGMDVTGAMAVLNVGSWETFVRQVLSHEAGSNNFTYNDDFGDIKWKQNQYYLEASLALLDAPEEWFYDVKSKTIYLILTLTNEEQGSCPDPSVDNLRGRTFDYGLQVTDTTWLTISNMSFWAANVIAYDHIDGITLDSLNFKFPSSSHRMLESDTHPIHTKIMGNHGSVINCTFEGAEGPALQYTGNNILVHNNEFSYNDWTGQGNVGTILDHASFGEFSQNTLLYNGIAHGLRYTGRHSNITLNHIVGQCWGKIQSDGASIQVSPGAQNGINISHNWVHDSPKKGIRFDGNGSPLGKYGYLGYNVVWNIRDNSEIYPKGDNHTVTNNVAYDIYDQSHCTLCVPSSHSNNPMNFNTVVVNNAATKMADGGGIIENNYASEEIEFQMIDPPIQDFRPLPGGAFTQGNAIIGVYDLGETNLKYWIPGRKLYKTSYPIPPDGEMVKYKSEVICQPGYLADQHHFYLGETAEDVDRADKDDDEFQYTLNNGENIFPLPSLQTDRIYYWRVDAQRGESVYKGDVWSFLPI